MTKEQIEVPHDLILQVRKLQSTTPVGWKTAMLVAEQQALRIRAVLGLKEAARMPLAWIERLPDVRVQMLDREQMEVATKVPGASGATTFEKDGSIIISLAENTSYTHKRFSLAHELKHLIDGLFARTTLYAKLGFGNDDRRDRRIEAIANEFAACLLMPQALIAKAWNGYGIQGLTELAGLFHVSEDAMYIRLLNLGLIRDDSGGGGPEYLRSDAVLAGL